MVYQKIRNVGHSDVEDIFSGAVSVEEKYDGSMFVFWLGDNGVCCRAKDNFIDMDNPGRFKKAVETVVNLSLHPEYIYYAEFLENARHNIVTYNREPKGNLVLFDVEEIKCPREDNEFTSFSVKHYEAERLGLDCVQYITTWTNFTSEAAAARAEMLFTTVESSLGGPIEGIVLKNYEYLYAPLFAKIVQQQFKEKHKRGIPKASFFDNVTEQYATKARFQKALQRLTDASVLTGTRADVGALVVAVQEDVLEEYGKEINEALIAHYAKEVRNAVIKGLPEWYQYEIL